MSSAPFPFVHFREFCMDEQNLLRINQTKSHWSLAPPAHPSPPAMMMTNSQSDLVSSPEHMEEFRKSKQKNGTSKHIGQREEEQHGQQIGGSSELEGSRSCCDSGNSDLFADWELIRLSVRELNQKLAGHDRSVVSAMKHKRRTLKNRGYALNCRTRRLKNQQQLEVENAELRMIVEEQAKLLAHYEKQLGLCRAGSGAGQKQSRGTVTTAADRNDGNNEDLLGKKIGNTRNGNGRKGKGKEVVTKKESESMANNAIEKQEPTNWHHQQQPEDNDCRRGPITTTANNRQHHSTTYTTGNDHGAHETMQQLQQELYSLSNCASGALHPSCPPPVHHHHHHVPMPTQFYAPLACATGSDGGTVHNANVMMQQASQQQLPSFVYSTTTQPHGCFSTNNNSNNDDCGFPSMTTMQFWTKFH